jgi:hypothetical protein
MRPHLPLSVSLILGLVCEAVSLVANGLQVVAAEQNSANTSFLFHLLFIGLSAALTVVMFAISAVCTGGCILKLGTLVWHLSASVTRACK